MWLVVSEKDEKLITDPRKPLGMLALTPLESRLNPAASVEMGLEKTHKAALLGFCCGLCLAWMEQMSLKLFLSPHSIHGLPILGQVNTMKSKVAQLTILPPTKPGAKGNRGNLFKNQVLLSCKSDVC